MRKPNIVLILVDDLGTGDFTAARMPKTHKLFARRGLSMNLYTQQNCVPSRVALVTGNDPSKYDLANVIPAPDYHGVPTTVPLIGETLQDAGYKTGIFGKWHLGGTREQSPYLRGFDEGVYFQDGHIQPYGMQADLSAYPDGTVGHDHHGGHDLAINGWPLHSPMSPTWLFRDATIQFMRHWRDEKHFAFVPFSAPHAPYGVEQVYFDRVKAEHGVTAADEAELFEYAEGVLAIPKGAVLDAAVAQRLNDALYYASTLALDDAIFDIWRALPMRNNTLFIFASDNGAAALSGDSGIYRGGKGLAYEGGHYVPNGFIWPNVIEAGEHVAANVWIGDFHATLAEVAGVAAPVTDGMSMVACWRGEIDRYAEGVRAIVNHIDKRIRSNGQCLASVAINNTRFKWIRFVEFDATDESTVLSASEELYDLNADVSEAANLIDQPGYVGMSNRLRQVYAEWGGDVYLGSLTAVDPVGAFSGFDVPDEWAGFENELVSDVFAVVDFGF